MVKPAVMKVEIADLFVDDDLIPPKNLPAFFVPNLEDAVLRIDFEVEIGRHDAAVPELDAVLPRLLLFRQAEDAVTGGRDRGNESEPASAEGSVFAAVQVENFARDLLISEAEAGFFRVTLIQFHVRLHPTGNLPIVRIGDDDPGASGVLFYLGNGADGLGGNFLGILFEIGDITG